MGKGAQLGEQFLAEHKRDVLEKKGLDPESKTTADLVRQLGNMKPEERQEFAKTLEAKEPGRFMAKEGPPRSPTDAHPPAEAIIYNGRTIPLQPKLESRTATPQQTPEDPTAGIGGLGHPGGADWRK